jgi:hypothetical protein
MLSRIYQYIPWDSTQYPTSKFEMVHNTPALMGCPIVYQYMIDVLDIRTFLADNVFIK